MPVVFLYSAVFFVAIAEGIVLILRNKKMDSMIMLLFFLVAVNSLGRYMICKASTVETAIWGNHFVYIGACFCPLVLLILMCRFCHIHMPRWLSVLLTTLSTIILLFALTVGRFPWYYSEVKLEKSSLGYSYLVKEYGPLHQYYVVMAYVYVILFVFCLYYAVKNRRKISVRTVTIISSLGLFILILYFLKAILPSHLSLVPLGYLVAIVVMEAIFERVRIYDMTDNIAYSVDKMRESGFIEFDLSLRLINYNDLAKDIFPELEKYAVDAVVPKSDSYFYTEIVHWLRHHREDERKTMVLGDQYYDISVRSIFYSEKKHVGYLVELLNRTAEHKYLNAVEKYNTQLEKEVRQKTEKIEEIRDMMVLGMATMVESRDNSTGGHIRRTSAAMRILADTCWAYREKLGLTEPFLRMLVRAAPMHDLGKIAVDDCVLRKKGKYTPEEYNEMKKHSAEGARILEEILRGVEQDEFVTLAKNVAHYHHEKWNGQGYPEGLKGKEIPLEARMMALVDVFDALVSKRCYKEVFSYDKAFSIMEESLGAHFDPELGRIFMNARPRFEALYDEMDDRWYCEERVVTAKESCSTAESGCAT